MRSLVVVFMYEVIEFILPLEEVCASRSGCFFFRVKCIRSCRPFCCGFPGWMRSMAIPSLSHQTERWLRLNNAFGDAKGTPLSVLIPRGIPNSLNTLSKVVKAYFSLVDSRLSQALRYLVALSVMVSG